MVPLVRLQSAENPNSPAPRPLRVTPPVLAALATPEAMDSVMRFSTYKYGSTSSEGNKSNCKVTRAGSASSGHVRDMPSAGRVAMSFPSAL